MNKILALTFIGCSLAEIKKYIHSPAQQVIDTLIKHKQQLMNKRRHIDKAIDTISRAEAMIKNKSRADSDNVLSLLWHYQHEEEGMQWFTEHISNDADEAAAHLAEQEER
ncbi:hypothetical protein J7E26_11410 [Bacillus sp. ISL-51]|uniref:hypothetical protein n=1 Tax=unclassified Bacillus (in: firmicutes) TaxID=185979 RepID=UPI001BEA59AF|nr:MULTISPECIES: hypothetical protein [unclassified Bacillus (in: firmicutes)]MBT2574558.1 hypothetical protein [Bacillus sp. ISL-51]MBT2633373.1 hypothetical protein [Bacillus sp. ISL-26]